MYLCTQFLPQDDTHTIRTLPSSSLTMIHTLFVHYPVPPSGWYTHGPYTVPLRMIHTQSLFCRLPPSPDTHHSQYSPTTLILVFLLFAFHLVSTAVRSLRSCHETFWPAHSPFQTAYCCFLYTVWFPLRNLQFFINHMSVLLCSANTTPFAVTLYYV